MVCREIENGNPTLNDREGPDPGVGDVVACARCPARTRGFPDPVAKCLPLDDRTELRVREIYPGKIPAGRTADDVLALMMANAHDLPEMPRLWRAIAIEQWANENGRELVQGRRSRRR